MHALTSAWWVEDRGRRLFAVLGDLNHHLMNAATLLGLDDLVIRLAWVHRQTVQYSTVIPVLLLQYLYQYLS